MERKVSKRDVYVWDFHNMKLINLEEYRYPVEVNKPIDWKPMTYNIAEFLLASNSNLAICEVEEKKSIDKRFMNSFYGTKGKVRYVQIVDLVIAENKGII